MLKKNDHSWFRVKKISPIKIIVCKKNMFIDTLEGKINAKKGDIICKGIEGEEWVQKKENLDRCYKPTGISDGEWKVYMPDNKNCICWAAELKVEIDIAMPFGTIHGKRGDYLLKETEKDSDIVLRYWIVRKKIFDNTYVRV